MTQVSYGTITITDTNDIESIIVEYARNQSTSEAPASGWSTTRPAWAQGYYIWQRTRIHKSGTQDSADTFGTAVCLTGSTGQTGQTGATGQSLSSTKTQYTNVASDVTITTSNHTNYTWTDNVPVYDSSRPVYWGRITNTYINPAKTEYLVYKDQGTTDAIKTSNDANTTAGEAKTIADNAEDKAQQASDDVEALENTYNNFIDTQAKYFIRNSTGSIVIGSREKESPAVAFDVTNVSTYGYNSLMAPSQISLRYNDKILSSWSSSALTFYKPSITSQGAKAMELTGSALKFYNPSNDSISMMDLTSTGLTFKTSAGATIGTFGSDSSGGLLDLSGRLNIKGGGRIGQDSTNYWEFGDNAGYNVSQAAYLLGKGNASIQLGENGHWRIDKNRIHTGWYVIGDSSSSTPAGSLHFDTYNIDRTSTSSGDQYYWDYGIHFPVSNTTPSNNKFLYIRYSNTTVATTTLSQMKGRIDNDNYWNYKFYVDDLGNVHAPGFYIGDSTTPIGGGAGTVAERLTQGYGSATQPIYFNSNGVPTNTTYTLNAAGAKGVDTSISAASTSTNLPTSQAVAAFVEGKGYITSYVDNKVQTSQANTTKIYLAGTSTAGTTTGTLNYDSNIYADTTAGALHATTFNGYTLAAASAKGVDTSLTTSSTSTNLPTSKAVVDLIKQYLPLTGGSITGPVNFGDSVSIDDLTAGNLIVNGSGRFTNGLYGDLIGNADTATKVGNDLKIQLNGGTTEGTNQFTFNGSAAKTVNITKSSIGLGNVENKSSATIRGELTSSNVTTALGFTPYNATNPNGYTTNTGTVTSVKVQGSNGLTGSGTVTTSGTITLSHDDTSSQASSSNSGRTYIQSVTLDGYGHVTGLSTATETVTNTHYTANLITSASATAKANAAVTTNGSVYLNLVENDTVRNAHKIVGSGTTTVTSDADGVITISSADSKTGTVTSITLTQGTGISIGSSGTAITTSGTRTIALADNYGDTKNPYASKTARYVLAAPANAAGAPSFRALTGADVGLGSVLNATQVTGIGQGADGKIRVYKGDSNYEDVAVEIVATESSSVASAQKLTSYGGSTKQPVYFPNSGTNAGKPVAIGYTIETSVPSGAVFTDTTYTFANGTNGFTVTPLNGNAQTVTVTPSITNNITGSGTSGYLAKFNGANTITNGPALGTDATKFLNNKGEWVVPGGTYSLPLAANGTRGGVQIGYTQSGKNYPVQLSSEKMYVNVPWENTTYTFTDANPTLAWSTKSKVATIGEVDIHVTMPGNPNTDTKVNVKTRGTTKAYLLGTTTSPTSSNQATESVAETGVYLDTTAGKLVATTFSGALSGNVTGNVTGTASGNITSVQYDSTNAKFTYTKNGTNTDIATIANLKTYLGLGAAAYKGVTDNSTATAVTSTDTNLITARTLYNAGYTKNTGTITGVTAGTGLSGGGTSGAVTLNHSNSITAKTAAAQAAKTLTWGGTFTLYEEKYDAQGHITGVASYNMTMPSNPNTDTKNTAGSMSTSSALFLIGATSQDTNPQTYSHDTVKINSTGQIISTGYEMTTSSSMSNAKCQMKYDDSLQAIVFSFA